MQRDHLAAIAATIRTRGALIEAEIRAAREVNNYIGSDRLCDELAELKTTIDRLYMIKAEIGRNG